MFVVHDLGLRPRRATVFAHARRHARDAGLLELEIREADSAVAIARRGERVHARAGLHVVRRHYRGERGLEEGGNSIVALSGAELLPEGGLSARPEEPRVSVDVSSFAQQDDLGLRIVRDRGVSLVPRAGRQARDHREEDPGQAQEAQNVPPPPPPAPPPEAPPDPPPDPKPLSPCAKPPVRVVRIASVVSRPKSVSPA